ncbi:hypothetical protein R1flu_008881 [Riccia fluitans]|uniref:Uncharacterized protein n=1 Tax=Riccia fluitans TaxID=41844 RepID=A0ABD1Z0H1_9MARC
MPIMRILGIALVEAAFHRFKPESLDNWKINREAMISWINSFPNDCCLRVQLRAELQETEDRRAPENFTSMVNEEAVEAYPADHLLVLSADGAPSSDILGGSFLSTPDRDPFNVTSHSSMNYDELVLDNFHRNLLSSQEAHSYASPRQEDLPILATNRETNMGPLQSESSAPQHRRSHSLANSLSELFERASLSRESTELLDPLPNDFDPHSVTIETNARTADHSSRIDAPMSFPPSLVTSTPTLRRNRSSCKIGVLTASPPTDAVAPRALVSENEGHVRMENNVTSKQNRDLDNGRKNGIMFWDFWWGSHRPP